jgi:hypothetical protein
MALIERVNVLIQTGEMEGAGTDGDVYAGVAGREFCCDSEADDFERGSEFYYRFGRNAEFTPSPMISPERNDPRKQDLRTGDVDGLPVYIRFAPEARDDNWYLKAAALVVNNDLSLVYWSVDNAPDGLWLGTKSGLVLHLRHYVEPRPVRAEMLENVKMLVRD